MVSERSPKTTSALDAPAPATPGPAEASAPPDGGGSLVDGGPPLGPLPPRIAGGEPIRYRFPDREPTAPAPPLEVDLARREKAPRPFGPKAIRTLGALAEVCAPSRDLGFDPGAYAAEFLAGYRPYLPRPLPALLPLAVWLLGWLPVLVGPRRRRLWRLDRAGRIAYLERLERGPALLAAAVRGFLGLIKFGIYHHPSLHQAIGYDPQPFIDRKVKERRERFGAPEAW